MATESLIRSDGAQCQAAANYWNPVSALFGPNGSGQYLAVFLSAARIVTLQTTATQVLYGILMNSPAQGQAADVALPGSICKAVAGAAITVNASPPGLMVDSNGRLIPWVAGAANYVVGYPLEAAAGANAIITVRLDTPFKVVT